MTEDGPAVIGWIETVDLPDLGLRDLKAKIDTGARTSALHAHDIRRFRRGDASWVAFRADTGHGLSDDPIEARLIGRRAIKNTSGVPETRLIVRTRLRLGDRLWRIDLSLSDRTNMTFPIIVGRAALKRHDIAVHTRRAYVATPNPERTAP
ncbi:ATP-dependent zinc protease [Jannaschia sp. LMIT008]|uniref:ATP-dependent zinc protease family protein n=1 Tax=Jannaschia maritima TaxID=3032585 RepID=UPI002811311B|nr:RimK/LysX family protein [Jannaschia sp. LMIT008]